MVNSKDLDFFASVDRAVSRIPFYLAIGFGFLLSVAGIVSFLGYLFWNAILD